MVKLKNPNHFPKPTYLPSELDIVSYPNALRKDKLAINYADHQGSIFLQPVVEHDFSASEKLKSNGLSWGQMVLSPETHEPVMVKYAADIDIVSLPAIINASINTLQGWDDIIATLVLTGRLLEHSQRLCGFVPTNLNLDGVAINRSAAAAELLLPFNVSSESSPQDAFAPVVDDIMKRCVQPLHCSIMKNCIEGAITQLGWEHEGANS